VSVRRNIAVSLGLAAVTVTALIFLPRWFNPMSAALTARQQAMEKLGERIAQLRPKCPVLVLANPFTRDSGYLNEKNQYERAGLRGLRKGLGGRNRMKVVFPEIRPEYFANPQAVFIPPDSRTPLSFLMQPASVEQLSAAHPECGVIVSLIGLPAGVDQGKIWHENDPRCFALLLPDLRLLGPPGKAVEAFQRGKLLAVVGEDLLPQPLIITRDNVVDVLKRQPKALGY
jgi:hypothetical protein